MSKLSNCPFCGSSKVGIRTEHDTDACGVFLRVRCSDCRAESPAQFASDPCPQTYQEVRDSWNRRATQQVAHPTASAGVEPDWRGQFEAWVATDTTIPLERQDDIALGTTGYASMEMTLMWHAWQAAKKSAPERARGEPSANARPGLASVNDTCPHSFSIAPSSGISLCLRCGLAESTVRRRAAGVEARKPLSEEEVEGCRAHVGPLLINAEEFALIIRNAEQACAKAWGIKLDASVGDQQQGSAHG